MMTIDKVMRYIKGTLDYGIWVKPMKNLELIGYSDNDRTGSVDDVKSTSGHVFTLRNVIFSWLSQKQDRIAQLIDEDDYIAAFVAFNQLIWLKIILA